MTAETNTNQVSTRVQGHVCIISLDNAAKRNAISPEMMQELSRQLTAFDDNDELWVCVLDPAGEHSTAGLDMPKFFGPGVTARPIPAEQVDPLGLGRRCRKPVIAVVHGITYTVGIEMMLAADIVVAADTARFHQLEARRGIAPLGGAHFRYLQRMGWGNAMYQLLLCEEFSAQRALEVGLVQEVLPYGAHRERAMDLAQRICGCAPIGLRATKAAALTYLQQGEAAAIAAIPEIRKQVFATADFKEGIQSFMERREAHFQGR